MDNGQSAGNQYTSILNLLTIFS